MATPYRIIVNVLDTDSFDRVTFERYFRSYSDAMNYTPSKDKELDKYTNREWSKPLRYDDFPECFTIKEVDLRNVPRTYDEAKA